MTALPLERLLSAFDAAIAAELPRVSHLEYDSHEICKHFAGKVRERLVTDDLALLDAEIAKHTAPSRTPLLTAAIDYGNARYDQGRMFHESPSATAAVRANERADAAWGRMEAILDGEIGGRTSPCPGCGCSKERCEAAKRGERTDYPGVPALKCCPDCKHEPAPPSEVAEASAYVCPGCARPYTQPSEVESVVADNRAAGELAQLRDFLCGEAAFGGYYFGDKHSSHRGAYWWRSVYARPVIDRAISALQARGREMSPRVARHILQAHVAHVAGDDAEANHELYAIACPGFDSLTPWDELEKLAGVTLDALLDGVTLRPPQPSPADKAALEAMRKYGDHYPECAVIQECGNAVKPACNCGYEAALTALAEGAAPPPVAVDRPSADGWQPIETAPKVGDCIRLSAGGTQEAIVHWDEYYAEGGMGFNPDYGPHGAWIEPLSGERFVAHYDPPKYWQQIQPPPTAGGEGE